MRNVGIKELKDQASAIVNAGEPVIIEKYGRPVGMYLPLGNAENEKLKTYQAAEEVGRIMRVIAERNGQTTDELADDIELLANASRPSKR